MLLSLAGGAEMHRCRDPTRWWRMRRGQAAPAQFLNGAGLPMPLEDRRRYSLCATIGSRVLPESGESPRDINHLGPGTARSQKRPGWVSSVRFRYLARRMRCTFCSFAQVTSVGRPPQSGLQRHTVLASKFLTLRYQVQAPVL